MEDAYICQVRWLDCADGPPKDWKVCDGSMVSIRSNTAVYSVLGINFGGDGTEDFGLPDLRHLSAPGAAPGTPHSGPPVGTMVPFVNDQGLRTEILIEDLAGAIPPPETPGAALRPCLCINGIYPQRD